MQTRSRIACLSAAVLAVWSSGSLVHADSLLFNPGQSTTGGTEGSGNWDNGATNWYDATTSTGPVAFNSSTPDSATFGVGNATALTTINGTQFYNVFLNDNVTVQNLTFGIAGTTVGTTTTNGHYYNLVDQQDGGQTLTLAGNVIKTSTVGTPQIFLTNAMQLTGGNHTFVINDSPGDVPAELAIQNPIAGATASITLDNTFGGANYQQYGTLLFGVDNTYAGGTTLTSGRLITRSAAGLGTGTLVVANAGAFQIGLASGGGQLSTLDNDITISNPIQITRSDYSSTTAFSRYTDAITVANDNNGRQTVTFTGAIDVASTDARIAANTNNIVISGPLTTSTGTGVLTLDGDFGGFATLTGDNTAFATAGGRIKIMGGVEVNASSDANLGGASAKVLFAGGTIHATGTLGAPGSAFLTNFGNHADAGTPINTGVDLDPTQVFVVNNLNGTAIGTRGTGTINFNGTNVFTGTPFFDGGTVNVNNTTTFAGFAMRSPVVTIVNGATLNTTSTANASVIVASDSPDAGTLNIVSGATLNDAGGLSISNNLGTNGKLNQAGTLSTGAELWVGNNNSNGTITPGTATFTQTAGSTTAKSWFVVGRYFGKPNGSAATGGTGTADIGGGTFTKINGGSNTSVAENGASVGTLTIHNNAVVALNAGYLYIGHNDTAKGTVTVADTASLTTNDRFYIGLGGAAQGTLTQSGGTITSNVGGGYSFDLGDSGTATGTFNKTGGVTLVKGETWIGSNSGTSVGNFNISGGTYTGQDWFVVGRNGSLGTLNITGGSITRQGGNGQNYVGEGSQQNSAINISAGSLTFNSGQFWLGNDGSSKGTLNLSGTGAVTVANNYFAVGRNGTATGVINMTGGTLTQTGVTTPFILGAGAATGTVNQSAGTTSAAATVIGEGGLANYNLSGGSASFGPLNIAQGGSANGTLAISGNTTVATAGAVNIGGTATSTGTFAATGKINLNGGSLTVASITGRNSTGAKTLNLNGGTLLASADSAAFVGGLTTANVQAGGAKINSNGHAVTIAQALVHDTTVGAPATDGGLTKSGVGSVTLTAANTYTGQTSVVAGTLVAGNTLAFGNSAVSVTNGGILQVQQKQPSMGISLTSLAVDSASKVDLTNGAIVVRNSSFSTLNTLVTNALVDGGNYDYNGNGIGSSNAFVRSSTDGATGVGVVNNADLGLTSFRGVTGLAGTSAENLVAYTFNGDTDLDGDVDGDDALDFLSGYQSAGHVGTWVSGDFDYNGVVNGDDFLEFVAGLNAYKGNATLALTSSQVNVLYSEFTAGTLSFSQLSAALPEPTSAAAAFAALAAAGRRSRRKAR